MQCWRALRQAVNTVIQGSAADILKTALIALHRHLTVEQPEGGAWCVPVASVHDEIVLEVRADCIDEGERLLRRVMTDAGAGMAVALQVTTMRGANWHDAK